MSAQILQTALYFLFSFFVFPFVLFNFIISHTNILPGIKSFVVISGSMQPVVPTGSVIVTKKENTYQKGDIITFIQNSKTISHRIVGQLLLGHEIYYATKGDANAISDFDLVSKQNIYGKTIGLIPWFGLIIMLYKTPYGFVTGTIAPLFLFAIFYFPKLQRNFFRSFFLHTMT